MPSSPNTPRHSRQSTMDFQTSSMTSSPQNRRQSKSSLHEPTTPLRQAFNNGDGLDVFSSGGGGGLGSGGLGNLADELADALSDDEYEYGDAPPDISVDLQDGETAQRDSGVDVAVSPKAPEQRERHMSLSLPSPVARHHRRAPSVYDGSEYGSDSDLDSPGMPPSLVAKIDAVESLARRGTESNGGPTDGVFKRVTDELRDLGSQSGVEGGATRYVRQHTAAPGTLTRALRCWTQKEEG